MRGSTAPITWRALRYAADAAPPSKGSVGAVRDWTGPVMAGSSGETAAEVPRRTAGVVQAAPRWLPTSTRQSRPAPTLAGRPCPAGRGDGVPRDVTHVGEPAERHGLRQLRGQAGE